MSQVITEERKKELLAVIEQQQNNWADNASDFSGKTFSVQLKLKGDGPVTLCFDGEIFSAEKAILSVSVESGKNCSVFIRIPNGKSGVLSDVVKASVITDEMDANLCLTLSFMGSELSEKMFSDMTSGPTNDPFMNMMLKFFG